MAETDLDASGSEEGLRDRLSRQGEDALGRVVEELAANPVVAGALARALQAREKAAEAQEAMMGALGIPSSADLERVTRRLRSISEQLAGIEEALDRLETRLDAVAVRGAEEEGRAVAIEGRLEEIARDVATLREAISPGEDLPPPSQERLTVPAPRSERARGRASRPRRQ